jgi:hypothetical protein
LRGNGLIFTLSARQCPLVKAIESWIVIDRIPHRAPIGKRIALIAFHAHCGTFAGRIAFAAEDRNCRRIAGVIDIEAVVA